METVTHLLSKAFNELGCNTTVFTPQPDNGTVENLSYEVVRTESKIKLIKSLVSSDVVIAQGECYKLMWPLLFLKKKTMMVLHTKPRERKGIWRLFDRFFYDKCDVFAVSNYVKSTSRKPIKGVIPNPYDEILFSPDPSISNENRKGILSVGITEGKGVMDLLFALDMLHRSIDIPEVTLVGTGGCCEEITSFAKTRSWGHKIKLVGSLSALALSKSMNKHKILVVPSKCNEAFGIVALEGLSSNCKLVCSNDGGLPEAAGPHATIFEKGDIKGLRDALADVLDSPKLANISPESSLDFHLKKHYQLNVAKKYLLELDKIKT
ncbi:glycosyltransferase family 4 protein [Vibrio sp. 1978]|uniref:glycosyltransferase family 4 protein n=1 Tax=Vibrio sp. 1978 TaxID=3074585 RepID=UPI0029676D30|nr:glycosyltransferase family 4 protein [Vibrio sp. 1978]MDW3056443.1 glycosyltransferase family 4 protein [Vibrio sp. 1978]